MPKEVFPVWTGCIGFAVWDTAALKSILPIKRYEPVVDWEFYIGVEFEDRNWKSVVHGGIICKHG